MDNIFKQRIITIRNISPYLTMQEIQKENLKDFSIHKLIKDGSTFHIYMSHADGDSAIKKLEKDLKALPMRSNSVGMKLHSNILCITGITSSLNEDILRQVLQGFGEVLLPFKLIKSKKTNESKGYGWLVFKDIKSAEKCMWMIAKIELQSRPLHAGWAGNNVTCEDDLSTVSTIYVQGLPSSIATVKDLRQFLSKNDEISFCQFLTNEDPLSQSNIAVVEFKNSEAAEQCVIKNHGTKVIDGILQLTYAIPGYAGVDFVWNKPTANIQFKRSQPNNRSLQHSNQCSGPIRLPKCCPSGYVRPMMNMQVTPGYQNTMGQIPSHYVPMSDMIRPQLVGVRPFVYTPTGLHSIQHSHVHQHFNYPQQYPVRNQQPHQQIMQYQQQQTTNEYQPQTPLPPNQLLPQQLPNQSQPPVAEMQQQILVEEHHQHPNLTSSIHSVVQHHQPVKIPPQPPTYHISFQQSQENDNLSQQPHEIAVSNQQQQEQSKQHSMALHHVEPKEKELSQKQLEVLTIAYQDEQQQKQKQQQHLQEKLQLGQKQKHNEKQQQQKQEEQPQQQQQQPQAQHQQQPQLQQHQRQPQQQQQQQEQQQKQQPKQAQQPQHQQKQQPQQHEQQQQETERNQSMKATDLSSEKEQREAEQQQKQETEIKHKQQNDKKAKQYNTETCSRTTAKSSHELNSNCSENYRKNSKQPSCLTSSSEQTEVAGAHTESHSVSNSISIDERQSIDGGKRHVNNGDNTEVKGCKPPKIQHVVIADQDQSTVKIKEGIKEHKQSKQDITAIRILQNTKMEDSKRGISLKPNGMSSPTVLKKTTDTKRTKKKDQLQQETLQPKQSLQIEKERQKDLPINTSEKKLLLPPKEKLLLLQQQIKRQAEALERLTRTKTKAELRQERNKTQKKSPCVPVKSVLQDSMITEKLPSEAKTHSEASSEVQLPKKCEGTKVSLPGKKSQDSLKLTEKEEDIAPRRSPSKVKLAERMNVHDDSETKEKRPRLDTDASSIRSSTENNASTKVPIKCSSDMTDINSTKSVGIYEKNNEKISNPGHPVDVFSMTPVIKSKPKKDQSLKPPKKTNELFSTSDEASSKLCSLMNQMSLKDEITGTTTSMDELKQVTVTTMATTTTPKVTTKEASVNLNKRCMESEGDDTKKVLGQITAQSNETDKLKTTGQQHCKYQDVNCQLSDKENMNVYLQEKPSERLCHKSDVATVQEKQKLPKPLGQEKQKSSPVVVVDSKAVNALSNVKMSERNIKIELGPTINQPGIIRPIPKIPLQSISSHGVVPEFSAIPMPSPFPHPHPQINNMQQFQTFTNNQFQPIMRAEAGMGRKVNFVFNHPVLPPMPSAHLLTQNDTFTTNTHYEPVMVPNPLFVGVPGMTGHTPHHIARPIPHIPPQPWQAMALPPMMHPRMTHFPPAYPPVLPNIGVNRNAPEFYSKMPERLPKIQPDAAFHLQYNNLANMQMRFAGRNLNDEASFHMPPPFKVDAQNPTAQFKNDFSTDRPAINLNNRDVFGYTAAGATNVCKNDGIPTIHDSTPVQASNIKSAGISSKVLNDLTYEQLVREQGNSSKDESKINIAEQQPIKMETKCFSAKQPMLKPIGNFKQSGRVPTFNRTVRELISVPFTSDESRLLYLLKKKHQGHPIAQEWLFFCNGLLTSHFRKLWDPPCKENDLHSNSEEVKTDCVCKREPDTLKCYSCSKQFFGRVRYHCELHPYREYLTDLMYCPYCGIDLVWTEEPW